MSESRNYPAHCSTCSTLHGKLHMLECTATSHALVKCALLTLARGWSIACAYLISFLLLFIPVH